MKLEFKIINAKQAGPALAPILGNYSLFEKKSSFFRVFGGFYSLFILDKDFLMALRPTASYFFLPNFGHLGRAGVKAISENLTFTDTIAPNRSRFGSSPHLVLHIILVDQYGHH
jgi:hypothetical protein